jgi:alcohol dehydrogenase class IV
MFSFTYNGQPARVIFGEGTLSKLPEEVDRLGLRRALILATPPQQKDAERLAEMLFDRSAGVFAGAVMHTPVHVTEEALAVVKELGADGLIAVGGGSTTGLAKALALRTDLPQIVAPTTYAGSEMTPILGETKDGRKVTQSSPKILPEVVIYDVDLTMTLPVGMSGTSGMNAIAHAVEALYAKERNPVVSLMALEAIGALAKALPAIADDPANREARANALYGAWLCGICLGSVGMALHHKLCHTLGGTFDLPHAETHTIVLPHALAYNAPAIPDVIAKLQDVFCHDDPSLALYQLSGRIGAKRALSDIGMPHSGIETATDVATSDPYWNPRPLDRAALHGLISRAYAGDAPVVETISNMEVWNVWR